MINLRTKAHEKLDEANIDRVIELLEDSSPITKKVACEMLNISYNTTRLNKIIEEHKDIMSYRAKRKSQNRGRKATDMEVKEAIQDYLAGHNISDISKRLYRSTTFVRNIINSVGVPEKNSKEAHSKVYKHKWILLPEQCVSDEFEEGERVWAVRDNNIAVIKREITKEYQASMAGYATVIDYEKKYGAKLYDVHVITDAEIFSPIFGHMRNVGYHSTALACDLGRLKHLEKYGVTV